jgi:hypothetical protein
MLFKLLHYLIYRLFVSPILFMRKHYCLLGFFLLPFLIAAQKTVPDFGKIDKADLQLKSCSFEPGATAMRLFDVSEITFEVNPYGTRLETEHRVRIKIFDEKGFKHASIRIPYFSKKRLTKIKDLQGLVHNLDASGNIVTTKLEKDDFFKEKAEKNIGIINFTFSNLKPGSVVEFRYRKIEKDMIQVDPWIPQETIPTAYASLVLTVPNQVRVKDKITGADTLQRTVENIKRGAGTMRYNYFREQIPSFQPEPFMSSIKDNLMKAVFMLTPASDLAIEILAGPEGKWRMAGTSLMRSERFGGQIKKTIPGTESLIDSAKKIGNTSERIAYLYNAVKKRMPDKAEQTLYCGDLEEAWKDGDGNSAEINLILLNLLRKADISAYPLLVSTRDNGQVDVKFPSVGQFNGVDVLAADTQRVYVLDASLKYQSSENYPMNILFRDAFLLEDGNYRWVSISDEKPLVKQTMHIVARMSEDGKLEGTAYAKFYDYAKSYVLDSTTKEDEEDKFFDKTPQGLTIISTKREDADSIFKPLLHTISFTFEPQQSNEFYFINPQLLSGKKDNPFKSERRNTHIDMLCNQELSFSLQLQLPPSFSVENLPKNIIVRAPDSSFYFKRMASASNDMVFLSQVFEIKTPIFHRDDYAGVKEFFERAFALMEEEIVFKKKK